MKLKLKHHIKKFKKAVYEQRGTIASISLGLVVIVGGILIHEQKVLASYFWTNTFETAWDTWPCQQYVWQSTCHFSCNAATVGQSCVAYSCYGNYVTASDGSTGNVVVDSYECDTDQPQCVAYQGQTCSSSANSCGQVNFGTYDCQGNCSAGGPPANPANLGNSCTSAQNSCGMTNSGSIQCNGSCSASTPSDSLCPQQQQCVPYVNQGCTSAPNSCQMTNSGTYDCNGNCSASTPSNSLCQQQCVPYVNQACTSAPNICQMTNPGTYDCQGNCSAITPSNLLCQQQGCSDTGPVSLKASPSVIAANTPVAVTLTWTVSNASAKCTLTGPNVNQQTGNPSQCNINGNYQTTVTITGPATFTLSCPGNQTANAVVRTVPQVIET